MDFILNSNCFRLQILSISAVTLVGQFSLLVKGYFLAMISESQFYVLNAGESVTLECNFHADQYSMFNHPVLWKKSQLDEHFQVNVLGNINEPFLATNRFDVSFESTQPRYRLELTITDVKREDSGNYTCEIRGTHSTVLANVVHYVYIRAPVESVVLTGDRPSASAVSPVPSLAVTHMVENHPTPLRCMAVGGYPPPSLRIHIGNRDVTNKFTFSTQTSLSGSQGMRVVTQQTDRWTQSYLPQGLDDGATLQCTVTVPGLSPIVQTTLLDVDYAPKVKCRSMEYYVGDTDVYLQCEIKAKPRVTSVFWILTDSGTTLMPGDVINDFWAVTKDRTDNMVEAQLFIGTVKEEKYRKYTIVAENRVAISRHEVELLPVSRSPVKQPLADDALSASHVGERMTSRDTSSKQQKQGNNIRSTDSSKSVRLTSNTSSSKSDERTTGKLTALLLLDYLIFIYLRHCRHRTD